MARQEDQQDGTRRLAQFTRDCLASGAGRQVLLVPLSRLPADPVRGYRIRMAREAVAPLAAADRGRLFELTNGDLAVAWRGPAPDEVDRALSLLQRGLGRGAEGSGFITLFDLPREAAQLARAIAAAVPAGIPAPPEAAPASPVPLDLPALAALERQLAGTDLSRFTRCRPVCRLAEGARASLVWDRRQLSLVELAEALAPGYDLSADRWLFRRLARTLDQRMLALLAAPDELNGAGPFALALSPDSLLSPAFLRFDAALPAGLRGQVLIELDAAAILADASAFAFARDFVQGRGYRLALGGVDASLVRLLPPQELGLDVSLLAWSDALAVQSPAVIAAAIAGTQPVLCDADTAAALVWGRAAGIRLFHGALARA